MRIGLFGSCRIKDPLVAVGADVRTHPSIGHIHNPLEILQALDLIDGREPPLEWLDLLNIRHPERLPRLVEADVFVVEVSSIRLVELDGWQLQIHRFREMLQEAGAPAEALKVLYEDMPRWRTDMQAIARDLPPRAAEILLATRHRELGSDEVATALDQIAARLEAPVLFVGPVAEGFGKAPPQRALLRDSIAAWGQRHGRRVLDPTPLVEDTDLKDLGHYREEALPRIGKAILHSVRELRAAASPPPTFATNGASPQTTAGMTPTTNPPLVSYSVTIDRRRSLTGTSTRFRFVGYSRDEVVRMEQDLAAVELLDAPQDVAEIRHARLTPLSPLHANAFAGNVFGTDGRPVATAAIVREGEVIFGADADAKPHVDPAPGPAETWYGGVLFSGYGHVLLESLSRLTPQVVASPLPILFHLHCEAPPDQTRFGEMLAYLGIDRTRIRWVDQVMQVERLLIPEPGFVIGSRVHLPWAGLLRDAVSHRLPLAQDPAALPILLSRSSWNGPRRKAFGEAELEAALGPAVRIVHPETLSFAEQVELVNASDRLMGPVGSQMHNLLLRARDAPPQVVYLCHARPPPAYFQVDLLLGGARTYVNAAFHGRVFAFGGASPYMLRLDRVHAGLIAADFPAPDSLTCGGEAGQRLEQAFYATWIERFIDMKLIRPSRYWKTPAALAEKADSFARLLADRLEQALADPQVAAILRSAARTALEVRQARNIPTAVKDEFLSVALGQP